MRVGHSVWFKRLNLGVGKPYFMEAKILIQGLWTVRNSLVLVKVARNRPRSCFTEQ